MRVTPFDELDEVFERHRTLPDLDAQARALRAELAAALPVFATARAARAAVEEQEADRRRVRRRAAPLTTEAGGYAHPARPRR